jgi:Tfp pilus assembly protein PilF
MHNSIKSILGILKNKKYFLIIRVFVYLLLFTGIVFGFKAYFKSVYNQEMQKNLAEQNQYKASFAENLKNSNKSAFELTNLGKKMLEANNPDYAAIILEIAMEKDPNYRDSAVLAGYAYITANNNNKAVDALNKASTIDPIYPRTFELLSIAYKNLKDDKNFNICYNKYKQLTSEKKEL